MKQPLIIPILFIGRERYQNFQDYDYLLCGEIETVPEGMIIDGASVPRFAWWFMPPDGLHRAGALAHDDIYGRQGIMPSGRRVTRWDADALLYSMMREAGVSRLRSVIVWTAVRTFGWHAWNKNTDAPIVLPVRNEAPTLRKKTTKNPFRRHIYATVLTP